MVVRQSIPMIGLSQAAKAGLFDAAGHPASHGWDEIPFPAVTDEHAYALGQWPRRRAPLSVLSSAGAPGRPTPTHNLAADFNCRNHSSRNAGPLGGHEQHVGTQ
jgi:hypothetical protein